MTLATFTYLLLPLLLCGSAYCVLDVMSFLDFYL
jgi:hypothetical protein